jgi:hypothetical protein
MGKQSLAWKEQATTKSFLTQTGKVGGVLFPERESPSQILPKKKPQPGSKTLSVSALSEL